MSIYRLKRFIAELLLGLGFILIISQILLYWFIYGDYERFIWIINGPYPFSHFGEGPFQLFMYLILFLIGMGLTSISIILFRNTKKEK